MLEVSAAIQPEKRADGTSQIAASTNALAICSARANAPILHLEQNNPAQSDRLGTDQLGKALQKGSWWVTS